MATEAEILNDILAPGDGNLEAEVACAILDFGFSDKAKSQIRSLLDVQTWAQKVLVARICNPLVLEKPVSMGFADGLKIRASAPQSGVLFRGGRPRSPAAVGLVRT